MIKEFNSAPEHVQLKTLMTLRRLSLRMVARASRVEYTLASMVLNGRRVDAAALAKLGVAIRRMKCGGAAA